MAILVGIYSNGYTMRYNQLDMTFVFVRKHIVCAKDKFALIITHMFQGNINVFFGQGPLLWEKTCFLAGKRSLFGGEKCFSLVDLTPRQSNMVTRKLNGLLNCYMDLFWWGKTQFRSSHTLGTRAKFVPRLYHFYPRVFLIIKHMFFVFQLRHVKSCLLFSACLNHGKGIMLVHL